MGSLKTWACTPGPWAASGVSLLSKALLSALGERGHRALKTRVGPSSWPRRSCLVKVGGGSDTSLSLTVAAECPDQSPELQPWTPGHDQDHHVHIGQGRALLLTASATVHSIRISEGGKRPRPVLLCWSLAGVQVAWLEMHRQEVTCFRFTSEHLVVRDNHRS